MNENCIRNVCGLWKKVEVRLRNKFERLIKCFSVVDSNLVILLHFFLTFLCFDF